MTDINSLSQRVQEIRERIEVQARPWGHDVRIIAVTKMVEPEEINKITASGIQDIGENRIQELVRKKNILNNSFFLHLIGQIQVNKVKYILNKDIQVGMVQSVDRKSLALELDRHAGRACVRLPVLVQVNIVPEPQKGGVLEADLPELLSYCGSLSNLHVQGLMWIAPQDDAENIRPYFKRVRQLFERLRSEAPRGVDMTWLSMGMSSDYETAVSEGANMVRLGSAIWDSTATSNR